MSAHLRSLASAMALSLLFAACVSLPTALRAQTAKAPVIAIIDMQRILSESSAVKAMQEQLDARRSSFQQELQKKEEALRKSDQELARQRAILSADAYAKRRQELERQVAEMRREIQERRKGLDRLLNQSMSQVRLRLVDIVKSIAKTRGADLVLAKAMVVLVRPDLEITDEALQRLNAELPSVALPVPQN